MNHARPTLQAVEFALTHHDVGADQMGRRVTTQSGFCHGLLTTRLMGTVQGVCHAEDGVIAVELIFRSRGGRLFRHLTNWGPLDFWPHSNNPVCSRWVDFDPSIHVAAMIDPRTEYDFLDETGNRYSGYAKYLAIAFELATTLDTAIGRIEWEPQRVGGSAKGPRAAIFVPVHLSYLLPRETYRRFTPVRAFPGSNSVLYIEPVSEAPQYDGLVESSIAVEL